MINAVLCFPSQPTKFKDTEGTMHCNEVNFYLKPVDIQNILGMLFIVIILLLQSIFHFNAVLLRFIFSMIKLKLRPNVSLQYVCNLNRAAISYTTHADGLFLQDPEQQVKGSFRISN